MHVIRTDFDINKNPEILEMKSVSVGIGSSRGVSETKPSQECGASERDRPIPKSDKTGAKYPAPIQDEKSLGKNGVSRLESRRYSRKINVSNFQISICLITESINCPIEDFAANSRFPPSTDQHSRRHFHSTRWRGSQARRILRNAREP